MDDVRPQIAVVVPTRGRETRLAFCLEALAEQTLDSRRFEVVVVRGDSAPPLAPAPPGLAVRFLPRPGVVGPTAKRNSGWRATAAPLIAFTDDDCRPEPQWLEALLAAAGDGAEVLQGRTEVDADERDLLPWFARSQEITSATGWFETCNIAYQRGLLDELGGFDESFEFGGEDSDLAYRALEAGATTKFVDAAVVRHAVVSLTVAEALRTALRLTDLPRVLARHPRLREALHHRLFWHPRHERLLLALAGLLLGRRLRSPVAAACSVVPYLGLRVNWREPRFPRIAAEIALVPLDAALDATQIAAGIPGALRQRVLVL